MIALLALLVLVGSEASERAKVDAAFKAARAVAHTRGCTEVRSCGSLPMGSRACGGPQTYVVFCSESTDSHELEKKVQAATKLEEAVNAKLKTKSTCDQELPPHLTLVNGECQVE